MSLSSINGSAENERNSTSEQDNQKLTQFTGWYTSVHTKTTTTTIKATLVARI